MLKSVHISWALTENSNGFLLIFLDQKTAEKNVFIDFYALAMLQYVGLVRFILTMNYIFRGKFVIEILFEIRLI